jgi:hypothetical protein
MAIGNRRAGSRYVPLNWHLTVPELTELLVDSESRLLGSESSVPLIRMRFRCGLAFEESRPPVALLDPQSERDDGARLATM